MIDCSEGYKNADEIINTIGLMLEKADQLGSDFNILADESALQDYEDRIYVKRALENAIDQDAVEIFLQPLIEADSGKLIGAEALARIRDSEGRIIPPGAFIPVAEKNGRINQLGEQVFEKVCRFICNNNIEEMGMKYINVNLSPIQFMRPDLGDRFATIVRRYGIKPDQIHLEITEEAIIDEQMMEKQVRLMQKNGFRFVLDDYGKGYSNLMRIKKTSFVTIKIDMEIVWDYCNSMDAVLPMMISAFKSLGLSITAEGIETEEMANKMRAIGCDYLQGMLFSAPVSVNSFLKKYRYGEDLNV